MCSIEVEQAVFTSADSGSIKGYQLVSRSAGIDRRLAQELCRWAPTHASLWGADLSSWSLNYFPIDDDWVAVTRTLYGGPEYSGRGGMQVVTLMLMLRVEQFAAYSYNPVALARTALALGHLRSLTSVGALLPSAVLPGQPVVRPSADPEIPTVSESLLAEVIHLFQKGRRVAIFGMEDPIAVFEGLVASMPIAQRLALSVTTGLKPSVRRCFRLHFLPSWDVSLRRRLSSQGIACVAAE